MASRIPGFTSGLKPPTSQVGSLAKRRGAELAATAQPTDKRPRTAEDAHASNGVNRGISKMSRSKSVSNLASAAQPTRPAMSRAPTTMSRPTSSTALNRTTNRTTACANITKRVDSITNSRTATVKGD